MDSKLPKRHERLTRQELEGASRPVDGPPSCGGLELIGLLRASQGKRTLKVIDDTDLDEAA
ncbi:hypothetical protein KKC94_01525 [Patescibacteria group bacterium]|nr:hypothetical protein [Patescibacteria group bacterium]